MAGGNSVISGMRVFADAAPTGEELLASEEAVGGVPFNDWLKVLDDGFTFDGAAKIELPAWNVAG